MLAVFMSAVEATIVATAMPTIVADLGGFRLFSWVFAAYLLTQAVTIPIYGRLADLYGRNPVFYVGAGLFLVGSTLCGFARGMIMLVLFRALQGLGAGAIQPLAFTIASDVSTPAERARTQGYLASVWGISSIIGPVLGAFLVQQVSWSVVFWINLPIGAAAIVMLALYHRDPPRTQRHRIDYLGAALLILGTGALMLALVQIDKLGAVTIAGLLGLAAVLLIALLRHEGRTPEPMLPLTVWRNPIVVSSNIGGFVIGALMMGVIAFLPPYIQGVMGRTAMVSGFVLTGMSVSWSVTSILAGRIMIRSSYRTMASVGGVFLIAGSALLIGLRPPHGPFWAALAGMLVGMGMGCCNTTFLVSVQTSVGQSERGAATAANIFMRNIGQSIGAALFGAVLNYGVFRQIAEGGAAINRLLDPVERQSLGSAEVARLAAAVAGALHNVYLIVGLLALVAFAVTFSLPRGVNPLRAAGER